MYVDEQLKKLDANGRDFPLLRGDVKLTLKNVHNGKTEKYERHNIVTNALADIFDNNYGGLLNYQSFADLYKTFMGGVLLFRDTLDTTTPNDYGIPAQTSNPCVAHAGQTPMASQRDDITRGDPDDYGTTLLENSTKLTFEWGTSAGNAPQISALGLTHTDVGSYGCGVVSEAQKSLNPFADVGILSRTYSYGQNAHTPLAIHGERAYNVYMSDNTTVHIYSYPINNHKYKLQGGALLPLGAYETHITATLPESYNLSNVGDFYFYFVFDDNDPTQSKVMLFGVPTQGGTTLYRDDINITTGTVTHSAITVTGAKLWKFYLWQQYAETVYNARPTKAIVYNDHLFVYGYTDSEYTPDTMFIVNLAQPADIQQVDMTDAPEGFKFGYRSNTDGYHRINERFATLGGIIAHRSFLINGDKFYMVSDGVIQATRADILASDGISAPHIGLTNDVNVISVCKLYLATKFNLPQPVAKTASQSMTVEYTLTEV